MNTKSMTREERLKILNEIFYNDPQTVKDWLQAIVKEKETAREERIKKMIDEDFDEYAEVFKALA